ncbi:MAG: hypothetical protein ACRCST_00720 [Turicibacter sp.]
MKTKTLGTEGQPDLTVLKGRHPAKVFNKAFKAEGWSNVGSWQKDDGMFGYGWFRKTKKGLKKSDINDLKAELYTYGEW